MEEQPLQHHGESFGFRYEGYALFSFLLSALVLLQMYLLQTQRVPFDGSTFLRFLVYLTGLVTIHCFRNYGYYRTASHFIQGACGPTVEWYTFPCHTYMERGLSAQLQQLY